jgi:CO/xanthine dehydrogenase FAD-binding subunit
MRSYVPVYDLRQPPDLNEALELLRREPGEWRPFAGGTDLMVLLQFGKLRGQRFLDLWRLKELRGVNEAGGFITIGALTTYTGVQRSDLLRREFPLLCAAAAETGGVATQNRGTLGGNIANASPAADSPPALLVYDAELELVSAAGSRWAPYRDFHTGYKTMDLHPDELIRSIRLPRDKSQWRQVYRKVGTRRAQAISKVCFAGGAIMRDGVIADARLAFGSVAPVPKRCEKTEALLRGQRPTAELIRAAQAALAQEIAPIDDMRSTARYRRRVAQNLLADFLQQLAQPDSAAR